MEKMGRFEDDMDSRIVPSGSASSASGYSLRSRGSGAKISPFCPHSSSKLTQSIIKDHMISHYKKVYSAKAAIDTSVPKSLLYSVKYNDQLKRGRAQNGVRPQSAHSLSQRSRTACSPAQSRLSLQLDRDPYLCSSSSLSSTPRPSTSFHPRSTVYPSYSGDQHHPRPSSERGHRSTLHNSLTSATMYSTQAGGDQPFSYRAFQDPIQKTYSGDLLEKHAQRFTEDKPFTPKTLKTDKSSYLSKYRYYRSPQRTTQDRPNASLKHDNLHKSTSRRKSTHEVDDRSQTRGISTDHDFSEDDLSPSYPSSTREHRSREQEVSRSYNRVSYKSTKSPISRSVLAEEEELKYLEFITDVTDDILSRGFISDSVVERVINRHVDMNRYHLNEGKMRHLLEVLRQDLKQPCNSPIGTLDFERQEEEEEEEDHLHLPNSFLQNRDCEETKDDTEQLHQVSSIKTSDSVDYTSPACASTLLSESEKTFVADQIDLSEEKGNISPYLRKYSSFSEEDVHENRSESKNKDSSRSEGSETPVKERPDVEDSGSDTPVKERPDVEDSGSDTPVKERPDVEDSGSDTPVKERPDVEDSGSDTPVKERPDVEGLGTALESLNVSDRSHCDDEEPAIAAVSDDEF
ncbi:spermatogenesis-associated protein 7 homolog [Boleophthalmus pectinirostris]|uniref:spermatogenesis-associated protein 7 homolog n=1 Tax=Boleophthalmus pectinirostris TaxID=150288 RepID=UPI0024319863|nr:spermatogenesis-associated protein 7 homolog [Boleophthalmus pectinirostris]